MCIIQYHILDYDTIRFTTITFLSVKMNAIISITSSASSSEEGRSKKLCFVHTCWRASTPILNCPRDHVEGPYIYLIGERKLLFDSKQGISIIFFQLDPTDELFAVVKKIILDVMCLSKSESVEFILSSKQLDFAEVGNFQMIVTSSDSCVVISKLEGFSNLNVSEFKESGIIVIR